jgi:branched-chain amino acid aminotransferase
MVTIRYTEGQGWHDAQGHGARAARARSRHRRAPLCAGDFRRAEGLSPARWRRRLFRADANARRFNQSALRMAMAELPEELFLEVLPPLVAIDRDWIPEAEGGALYLRPFMFASEVFLGVKPASEYLLHGHRLVRRRLFQDAHRRVAVGVRGLYARGARRHRAKPSAAAIMPPA